MKSHRGTALDCRSWGTHAIWWFWLCGGCARRRGTRRWPDCLGIDIDVDASIRIDDIDGESLEFFAESSANPVGGESSSGTYMQLIIFDRQLRVLEPHCDGSFTQAVDELSRQSGRDVVVVGGHVIELLLLLIDSVVHILPNESDVSSFGTFFRMRNIGRGSAACALTRGCTPVFTGSQSS